MNAPLIFDTDTHVTEPADLWTSRLPKAWGDDVLHVEWNEKLGAEVWCSGGRIVTKAWGTANFGWGEPWPSSPPTINEVHPATYDLRARLEAMDDSGVRIAVLYPNLAGFAFHPVDAPVEFSAAHVRAYNDYLMEWTAPARDRFLPMAVIPYWSVEESVREIERSAALGFRGITTTGAPHRHDQPYLGDHHWDPIWAACQDAGLRVSFHAANGGIDEYIAPRRLKVDGIAISYARTSTAAFLDNGHQVTDLLLSGVLPRFPDLKFVSVESGLGWIPFVLESCDYHFKKGGVAKERCEFGDALPSDLFRRQVYVNYWFERLEQWHVDAIGADNILFETDFPHPTCLYGNEVDEALRNGLDSMPEGIQRKILWDNAAALYGVSPP